MGIKAKVNALSLNQFTAFENANFDFSPGINVLIGANSTGKTHLMKIIYTILKVVLSIKNGENETTAHRAFKLFALRMQNIFNIPGMDKYIRNNNKTENAEIILEYNDIPLKFIISHSREYDELYCEDSLVDIETPSSTIYLPPKEFLSINDGFIATYNNREIPYDETYYDLALALNALPLRPQKLSNVKNAINILEDILVGNSFPKDNIISNENGHFYFNLPEGKLDVHFIADGLKKIGMLLFLLKNGSLDENSILFWDEPETNLNPQLIVKIVGILKEFALSGMQIFITTHDYLLSNELSLLAENPSSPDLNIKFFALHKPDRKSGIIVESGQTIAEIENNPILEEFASHYDRESALFQNME